MWDFLTIKLSNMAASSPDNLLHPPWNAEPHFLETKKESLPWSALMEIGSRKLIFSSSRICDGALVRSSLESISSNDLAALFLPTSQTATMCCDQSLQPARYIKQISPVVICLRFRVPRYSGQRPKVRRDDATSTALTLESSNARASLQIRMYIWK